jgi:hypothetical protein
MGFLKSVKKVTEKLTFWKSQLCTKMVEKVFFHQCSTMAEKGLFLNRRKTVHAEWNM